MSIKKIKKILEKYTAEEFAEMQVNKEKEKRRKYNDYSHYMYSLWSNDNKIPLKVCIKRSYDSSMKNYKKMSYIYKSWKNKGKLFVLNTREFIVLSYSEENNNILLIPEYNPKHIDIIEVSIKKNNFSELLKTGEYIISKKRKELINDCNIIISNCL